MKPQAPLLPNIVLENTGPLISVRVARGAIIFVELLVWSACGLAQQDATVPSATDVATPAVMDASPLTLESEQPGAAPGRIPNPKEQILPSKGKPLQAGSFLVYPEIDVTALYDTNVYFSNTDAVSDHGVLYSPAVWVQSNWVQHALNFYAAADAMRYNHLTSENSDDYRISAEGRYDLSESSNLYGGSRFSRNHEDRESPDARNGLTPTLYNQYQYYGGFFNQIDRWSVRVGGTAQELNYRDVNFLTAGGVVNIINNDDRDRWQYGGGVRVGYESSLPVEWYGQIAVDNRRYTNSPDDLGYQRNSDGRRYLVGVKWKVPKKLKLDAFAGRLQQDYKDPRATDINSPVIGGALLWAVSEVTELSVYFDRTVEETTVTQTSASGVVLVANSYLNTYASLGLNHRLSKAWSVRAGVSQSHVAYQGLDRNDNYGSMSLGMAYRIHRNLILDIELSNRRLNSSIPTEDFSKRELFVRLAIPFSH